MKNVKLQKWQKIQKQIEKAVDAIGYPMDEGIKETVVAFNATGFPTSASCEGHLDHSLVYPWIDIMSTENTSLLQQKANELFKKARELDEKGNTKESSKIWGHAHLADKKAHIPILKLSEKFVTKLTDFYRQRNTPYDVRLTVHQFSDRLRVESIGGFLQEVRPLNEKKKKLREYQKEMREFGEFLKETHFGQ